jgi:hypothetical protein
MSPSPFLALLYLSIAVIKVDLLCGLVVRVPGYRSRGLDSITGATRLSEEYWVWNGSTQPREYN